MSFADADVVILSQVARLEQLAPGERLNPAQVMTDLKSYGKEAAYLPDADAIVAHVVKGARGGDVVVVFSNGGFDGIHGKLLAQLGKR
jgi:UDP-N-acetylmuramate: L-alanyl-gamma-D-glutamyl-meso-diaminopimelate ligase